MHWLNGGEIEWWDGVIWVTINENNIYLLNEIPEEPFRIKPKTEKIKLWVGIHKTDLGDVRFKYRDPENSLVDFIWTEVEVDKQI